MVDGPSFFIVGHIRISRPGFQVKLRLLSIPDAGFWEHHHIAAGGPAGRERCFGKTVAPSYIEALAASMPVSSAIRV